MMKILLMKLLTLLEIIAGSALLLAGISGYCATFVFNALLVIAGFFVLIDGVDKIDKRDNSSGQM